MRLFREKFIKGNVKDIFWINVVCDEMIDELIHERGFSGSSETINGEYLFILEVVEYLVEEVSFVVFFKVFSYDSGFPPFVEPDEEIKCIFVH